jgi:hypothetical protein
MITISKTMTVRLGSHNDVCVCKTASMVSIIVQASREQEVCLDFLPEHLDTLKEAVARLEECIAEAIERSDHDVESEIDF